MSIGEQIKLFRNKKGLTQEELAIKCDLSKNGLWNYENNKREPSIETLKKIATELDVSVGELISDFKEELRQSKEGYVNHKDFINLMSYLALLPEDVQNEHLKLLQDNLKAQRKDLILDTITLIMSELITSEGVYNSKEYFQYFVNIGTEKEFNYYRCAKMFVFLINQVKVFIDNDCDFN